MACRAYLKAPLIYAGLFTVLYVNAVVVPFNSTFQDCQINFCRTCTVFDICYIIPVVILAIRVFKRLKK